MLVSIFTPTYNRALLLSRVYESLLLQTNQEFEWLIVDDGSTDDTESIVTEFINAKKLPITYHKQENRGKHFAINKGVSLAKAALFFIVDSDDFLPADAVETILGYYQEIKDKSEIAGIAGRRIYRTGEIVGNSNFKELLSDSVAIRYQHKVTGDLVEVFKTPILKMFPFPEVENEKFCPEALVWNRIAQKYSLLFFNKGIYVTEYLPGGLTSKIVQIRMKSPTASMLTYSELAKCRIPLLERIKATINFWRFAYNSKIPLKEKFKYVSLIISIIASPLGFLFYLKDKIEISMNEL